MPSISVLQSIQSEIIKHLPFEAFSSYCSCCSSLPLVPAYFFFVCQNTVPPVLTWKKVPLTLLYMCARLGQRGAIRGNVKQLYMSAYATLTATQTASMGSKQWNNVLVCSCQNRRPWFSVSFMPFALLHRFLNVSQSGQVRCPFLDFQ